MDAKSFCNNVIHCKVKDTCIAWVLTHCKNNAIHCKNDDVGVAWMLSNGKIKKALFIVKSMIYVLPVCEVIAKTTLFIVNLMIYVLPGC